MAKIWQSKNSISFSRGYYTGKVMRIGSIIFSDPCIQYLAKLAILLEYKYHRIICIALWQDLFNERVAKGDASDPHDFNTQIHLRSSSAKKSVAKHQILSGRLQYGICQISPFLQSHSETTFSQVKVLLLTFVRSATKILLMGELYFDATILCQLIFVCWTQMIIIKKS